MWGSIGFIFAVAVGGALMQWLGIEAFPVVVAVLNGLLLLAALRLPPQRDEWHDSEAAPPPVLRRLLEPSVAWFFASIFFTVLAHTAMYAFFSLYLVQLGYGKAAVGGLWAVGVAAEIVFFWQQGRWFRRLASETWLQVAAATTALRFAVVAGLGAWPAVLLLAQLSHALTFAAHHAACIDLVQRHFPGRLRGRGQALYTILGYGISGVLGGVGGGWLIDRLGYASAFWAASAMALIALVCAWRAARHVAVDLAPEEAASAAPHARVAQTEVGAGENRP